MNISIPGDVIQYVIEYGYINLVNGLSALELDRISEYLNHPLQFQYESVVIPVQKLARKLIFNPGEDLVKMLRFKNYVVPLDVALGGYYILPVPFTSYAHLATKYSNVGAVDSNGNSIKIPRPELVVPERISNLVNQIRNNEENYLRLAILRVAEELNHPILDNDYQSRVWSLVESGTDLEKFGSSMKKILSKLKNHNFTSGEGVPIRQYWWRALIGHFGIDEDRFTLCKDNIAQIIRQFRGDFTKILYQSAYNEPEFKRRMNSILDVLDPSNENYSRLTGTGARSKFRTVKESNLEDELRLNIRKNQTPIELTSSTKELPPLPIRDYTNDELRFLYNFETGLDIDDYLKQLTVDTTRCERHESASIFMYKLNSLDDEYILQFREAVKVLAQGRSFEDLINYNIMYPKLRFIPLKQFDGNSMIIIERAKDLYNLLDLDIPFESTFSRTERLRILIEQSDYIRTSLDSNKVGCSWFKIMGEMILLDSALPEHEYISRLSGLFFWSRFMKSKTGAKLVKDKLTDERSLNRLRYIISDIEDNSKIKVPISLKELVY